MRNADDYDNDDYVRPTGLPSAQTYAVLSCRFSIRSRTWSAHEGESWFCFLVMTSPARENKHSLATTNLMLLRLPIFDVWHVPLRPLQYLAAEVARSAFIVFSRFAFFCSFTGDQQGVDCLQVEVLRLNWHLQPLQVIWAGFWRSASSVLKAWA